MSFDPAGLTVYIDGEYVTAPRPASRSGITASSTATGSSRGCASSRGRSSARTTTSTGSPARRRALGLELPLAGDELLDVICEVIVRSGLQDAHVRPIVTRGFGAPGLDPSRCERSTLIVAAYPFPPLLGSDPISVSSAP